MNLEGLVGSYQDGLNKARVYTDRVEIGIFMMKAYPIADIRSVELSWSIPTTRTVTLLLRDGTKSYPVALSTRNAELFRDQITVLVQKFQQSLDAEEGSTSFPCTVLGGSGTSLKPETHCTVIFGRASIYLFSGSARLEVKLAQLTKLDLDGPGRVTSNAGVWGGGFGLEGAAQGIAMATLINALTTTTTTNTIMHLAWPGAEVFLHTSSHTPEEARILLSYIFVAQSSPKSDQTDIATQLERLRALWDSGALTADEYNAAKAKALGT